MDTSKLPEFLSRPAFWFAAVNAIAVILGSFGVNITAEVIAAVNLVVAAAFNVAPPINSYVAAKRYSAAAKSTLYEKNTSDISVNSNNNGLHGAVLFNEKRNTAYPNNIGTAYTRTDTRTDPDGNTYPDNKDAN